MSNINCKNSIFTYIWKVVFWQGTGSVEILCQLGIVLVELIKQLYKLQIVVEFVSDNIRRTCCTKPLLNLLEMSKWLEIWYKRLKVFAKSETTIMQFVTSNFCWCHYIFKITSKLQFCGNKFYLKLRAIDLLCYGFFCKTNNFRDFCPYSLFCRNQWSYKKNLRKTMKIHRWCVFMTVGSFARAVVKLNLLIINFSCSSP